MAVVRCRFVQKNISHAPDWLRDTDLDQELLLACLRGWLIRML